MYNHWQKSNWISTYKCKTNTTHIDCLYQHKMNNLCSFKFRPQKTDFSWKVSTTIITPTSNIPILSMFSFEILWYSIAWTLGTTHKVYSEVKPDALGKIKLAHELAWFLRKIKGRPKYQASPRLSQLESVMHAMSIC